MPTTAFADVTSSSSGVSVEEGALDAASAEDTVDISEAWSSGEVMLDEAGTYVLDADVQTEHTLYIAAPEDAEIVLDFNGHTATVQGGVTSGIDVTQSAGTVKITDSSYEEKAEQAQDDEQVVPDTRLYVNGNKVADALCGIYANFASPKEDVVADDDLPVPVLQVENIGIEVNLNTIAADGAGALHDAYGVYVGYQSDQDPRTDVDVTVFDCAISSTLNNIEVTEEKADELLESYQEAVLSAEDTGIAYALYTNRAGTTLDGYLSTTAESSNLTADLYSCSDAPFTFGSSLSPASAMRVYANGNAEGSVFAVADAGFSADDEFLTLFVDASGGGLFLQAAGTGELLWMQDGQQTPGQAEGGAMTLSYESAASPLEGSTDLYELITAQPGDVTSISLDPGSYYLSQDLDTQNITEISLSSEGVYEVDLEEHTLTLGGDGSTARQGGYISVGSSAEATIANGTVEAFATSGSAVIASSGSLTLKSLKVSLGTGSAHTADSALESLCKSGVRVRSGNAHISDCEITVDFSEYTMGGEAYGSTSVTYTNTVMGIDISIPRGVTATSSRATLDEKGVTIEDSVVSVKTGTPSTSGDVVDAIALYIDADASDEAAKVNVANSSLSADAQQGSAYALYNFKSWGDTTNPTVELSGVITLNATAQIAGATPLAFGVVNAVTPRPSESSSVSGVAVVLDCTLNFTGSENAHSAALAADSGSASSAPFVLGGNFSASDSAQFSVVIGLDYVSGSGTVARRYRPWKPTGISTEANTPNWLIATFADDVEASQKDAFAALLSSGAGEYVAIAHGETSIYFFSTMPDEEKEAYIDDGGELTYYITLSDAAEEVESGQTITLNRDVEEVTFPETAEEADATDTSALEYTIDFAGHTAQAFTNESDAQVTLISSQEGGAIELLPSTSNQSGIAQDGKGLLIVDGVDIYAARGGGTVYGVNASASSSIDLKNLTIDLETNGNQVEGVRAYANVVCTISDCTIDVTSTASGTGSTYYAAGVHATSANPSIAIYDSDISAWGSAARAAALDAAPTTTSVSDSSLKAYAGSSETGVYSVYTTRACTGTFDNVEFGVFADASLTDEEAAALTAMNIYFSSSSASITLSGACSFESFQGESAVHIYHRNALQIGEGFSLAEGSDAPVYLSSGTYSLSDDVFARAAAEGSALDDLLDVFSPASGSSYEGYEAELGDGVLNWSSEALAQIGNEAYNSLSRALAAAEDGDEIDILRDCTQPIGLSIDKDLTIDLNGWDVTLSGTVGSGAAIAVSAGTVKVTDSAVDKGSLSFALAGSSANFSSSNPGSAYASPKGFNVSGSGRLELDSCDVEVSCTGLGSVYAISGVYISSQPGDDAVVLEGATLTVNAQQESASGITSAASTGAYHAYGIYSAGSGSVNVDSASAVNVKSALDALTQQGTIVNTVEDSTTGGNSSGTGNENRLNQANVRRFYPAEDSEIYAEILEKFLQNAKYDGGNSGTNADYVYGNNIYYASPMILDDGTAIWAFSDVVPVGHEGDRNYIVPSVMYIQSRYDVTPDVIAIGGNSSSSADVTVAGTLDAFSVNGNATALEASGTGTWRVDGATLSAETQAQTSYRTRGGTVDLTDAHEELNPDAFTGLNRWYPSSADVHEVTDGLPEAVSIAEGEGGATIKLAGTIHSTVQGSSSFDIKAQQVTICADFTSDDALVTADRDGQVVEGETFAIADEGHEITQAQRDLFVAATGDLGPNFGDDDDLVWDGRYTLSFIDFYGNTVKTVTGVTDGATVELPSEQEAAREDSITRTYPLLGWSSDPAATVDSEGFIAQDASFIFEAPADGDSHELSYYAIYGNEAKAVTLTLTGAYDSDGAALANTSISIRAGENLSDEEIAQFPQAKSYSSGAYTYVFVGWTYTYNATRYIYSPETLSAYSTTGDAQLNAYYVPVSSNQRLVVFRVDDYVYAGAVSVGSTPSFSSISGLSAPARDDDEANWTFAGWLSGNLDVPQSVESDDSRLVSLAAVESGERTEPVYYTAAFSNTGAKMTTITLYYYFDSSGSGANWTYNSESYSVPVGTDLTDWVRGSDGTYTYPNTASLVGLVLRDYVTENNDDTYTAHRFRGWSVRSSDQDPLGKDATDEAFSESESAGELPLVSTSGTSSYYAIYTSEDMPVDVTFDTGESTTESFTLELGSSATLQDALEAAGYTQPVAPEGKVFVGWAQSAGGNAVTNPNLLTIAGSAGFEAPQKGDGISRGTTTFYAVFADEAPVTVTFDANGGTMSVQDSGGNVSSVEQVSSSYEKGSSLMGNVPTPTRDGYSFVGWNTAADGTGAYYDVDETVLTEDITLYAIWQQVDALQQAKDEYTQRLDNTFSYAYEANMGNYTGDENSGTYGQVCDAYNSGRQAIANATSEEEVVAAYNQAVSAMASVENRAQLQSAIAAALEQLANAYAGYSKSNYTDSNWEKLTSAYTSARSSINSASTVAEAASAASNGILAMSAVSAGTTSGSSGSHVSSSVSSSGSSSGLSSSGGRTSSGLASSVSSGLSSGGVSSGLSSGSVSSGLSSNQPGATASSMLGGTFETLDEDKAAEYGTAATSGVYVSGVDEGGPLDLAGVQVGDVITAVNGQEVSSVEELDEILSGLSAGESVTLTIDRNGQTLQLTATLDEDSSGTSGLSGEDSSSDNPTGIAAVGKWIGEHLVLFLILLLMLLALIGALIWWLLRRRRNMSEEEEEEQFDEEQFGTDEDFFFDDRS